MAIEFEVEKVKVALRRSPSFYRMVTVLGLGAMIGFAVFLSRDTKSGGVVEAKVEVDLHGAKAHFTRHEQAPQDSDEVKTAEEHTSIIAPQAKAAEQPERQKPVLQKKRVDFGWYYEAVRSQGDAFEDEFVIQKRRCVPVFSMPDVCYMPQNVRKRIILIAPPSY